MSKQNYHVRRQFWKAFGLGLLLLLGTGLFLVPKIRSVVHPVLYISSEQPTVVIENPHIRDGEVELEEITLTRGEPVTLLSKTSTVSTVRRDEQTFTLDNHYLAGSLEEALKTDVLYPRHLINLRTQPEGELSSLTAAAGEELKVLEASPDWLDRQSGEMRWYKVEKNGQEWYVPGTAVSLSAPAANAGEDENSIKAQTDLAGYTQPDWPDNPRLSRRSGIHVTLENLLKYESQICDYIQTSGMNTIVVALKGPSGQVWYDSSVPAAYYHDADEMTSHSLISQEDLKSLVERMHAKGIYMVGRLETFQDSYLCADSPELAITDSSGSPVSLSGSYWLSPFSRKNWQYNSALAKELARMGFNEIQFDFCRFPDGRNVYGENGLDLKNQYDETEAQAVQNFLYYVREELEPLHVYTASDIYAGPVYEDNDYSIGQYYPAMLAACNYVCPMAYLETLQFLPENTGIEVFSSAHEVMASFARQSLSRQAGQNNVADLCIWLQGFGLMSPETLRAQLDGVHEGGIDSWMLWTDEGDLDMLLPLQPAFAQNEPPVQKESGGQSSD